ncbi:MAG: DUF6516 family protein [Pseudomonadota bacterium]|uniref:toxin-antitoxin system TumE family protein n=1 Tax=Burkholderiaceae TaxID=119060 RepID=UPI0010FA5B05|nr:DUF6516 family protein [Burkholderia sp. 4M9327F10]
MPAKRIFYDKQINPIKGTIIEMVIWHLPSPVVGSRHRFKYRLFFGRAGERVVGYDNEQPKGDHRHVDGRELPYQSTTPEQLIADFLADVREAGG